MEIIVENENNSRLNRNTLENLPNLVYNHVRQQVNRDYRVQIFKFCEENALKISCVSTCLLLVTALYAIISEADQVCESDNVKVWLAGTTSRAFVSTLVKLYAAAVDNDYISHRGDPMVFQKMIEMLDVFGMVWFCIGNLLVFNDFQCLIQTPAIFLVSFLYIILVYAFIVANILLRISLATSPPTSEGLSDLLSVRHVNHGANQQPDTNAELQMNELTAVSWQEWLESYGCKEMTCNQWLHEQEKANNDFTSSSVDGQHYSTVADVETGHDRQSVSCPICLIEFHSLHRHPSSLGTVSAEDCGGLTGVDEVALISIDKVVSFPCHARHVFHARCIHHWLETLTQQNRNITPGSRQQVKPITCPCCRETASSLVNS